MTAELVIRQALFDDAPAVVSLLKKVQQETDYLQMEHLSVDQQSALLTTYAQSTYSIMLLAELSGEVIGLGNLIASSDEVAELGVCVCQAYWGYGIGTALVADLIDFAEEVGIQQIVLEVMQDNERAIHLYRSFGFVDQPQQSPSNRRSMMRQSYPNKERIKRGN